MNKLDRLFAEKKNDLLNMYCTAGYPHLDSTVEVINALQSNGADIVELGIPYSDPLADGPVIQQSNMRALENGMSIARLFEQLMLHRKEINVPLILMGYMNPVLQYGMEKFCEMAAHAGVDGIILPDLPMYEFENIYVDIFRKYDLKFIFLVTPETEAERIRKIDACSTGFIYAVSSSSTTGSNNAHTDLSGYLLRLKQMDLYNPVMVGFGIKDNATFREACRYSSGAIVGSAYIKALENSIDIDQTTKDFIISIKGPAHLPNSK